MTHYTYGRTTGDHIRPGFELRRMTDPPGDRPRTEIIGLGMTAPEADLCAQVLNACAATYGVHNRADVQGIVDRMLELDQIRFMVNGEDIMPPDLKQKCLDLRETFTIGHWRAAMAQINAKLSDSLGLLDTEDRRAAAVDAIRQWTIRLEHHSRPW